MICMICFKFGYVKYLITKKIIQDNLAQESDLA